MHTGFVCHRSLVLGCTLVQINVCGVPRGTAIGYTGHPVSVSKHVLHVLITYHPMDHLISLACSAAASADASHEAATENITMLAVGVGREIHNAELVAIAGGRVFNAKDDPSTVDLVKKLKDEICGKP